MMPMMAETAPQARNDSRSLPGERHKPAGQPPSHGGGHGCLSCHTVPLATPGCPSLAAGRTARHSSCWAQFNKFKINNLGNGRGSYKPFTPAGIPTPVGRWGGKMHAPLCLEHAAPDVEAEEREARRANAVHRLELLVPAPTKNPDVTQ
jgi:hypothetical protein